MAKFDDWCRQQFGMMADGGAWAVPRSALIFKRRGPMLVLVGRMPHHEALSMPSEEWEQHQQEDFEVIRDVFKKAGIEVIDESQPVTHEVKPYKVPCPTCKDGMDAAVGPTGGRGPKQGDYTICGNCGEILRFGKDCESFTVATDEEMLNPELPVDMRHALYGGQAEIRKRGRWR